MSEIVDRVKQALQRQFETELSDGNVSAEELARAAIEAIQDTDNLHLSYRIWFAADQLCRYSGEPYCEEFADVMDALTDINDDMCNGRTIGLIKDKAEEIKALLDKIVAKADPD